MKMMDGRTCLMIAHRLETLKQCDRILVFNNGALVEEGKLVDLMTQGNYFYKLHNAQAVH